MKNYRESLEYLRKAFSIIKKFENENNSKSHPHSYLHFGYAQMYYNLKKFNEAFFHIEKALQIRLNVNQLDTSKTKHMLILKSKIEPHVLFNKGIAYKSIFEAYANDINSRCFFCELASIYIQNEMYEEALMCVDNQLSKRLNNHHFNDDEIQEFIKIKVHLLGFNGELKHNFYKWFKEQNILFQFHNSLNLKLFNLVELPKIDYTNIHVFSSKQEAEFILTKIQSQVIILNSLADNLDWFGLCHDRLKDLLILKLPIFVRTFFLRYEYESYIKNYGINFIEKQVSDYKTTLLTIGIYLYSKSIL